jgi:beta-galactosidase GanA
MKPKLKFTPLISLLILMTIACSQNVENKADIQIPYLRKQGTTTQLIVNNKPFIILGGELGNSTFTSIKSMKPVWDKLEDFNLNTILVPIYWELIEPTENTYDFTLYDELIKEAGEHKLKLIPLWFGAWKNSMSSYAPAWVKKDQHRFPRIKDEWGKSREILTPFSENNLQADMKAYEALMKHIRNIDGQLHTVIMVQTENEIGMLPSARDHSALANEKFNANVPSELMDYLIKNKENLVPEFKERWAEKGFLEHGTWEDIFGKSPGTDEIFMAWYYSKYVNAIIEAGKKIYPIPMYVNAALNRPNKLPGEYPSAGPLPHLMDIWQAGGPSIDILSPDFYFSNIKHWCDLYVRQGNPLFIPEHQYNNTVAAKAAFTIGHYESLGFSPFSIESVENPGDEPLSKMYDILGQLTPVIAANQGSNKIEGVLLDKMNPDTVIQLGDYELTFKHSHMLEYDPDSNNEEWDMAGAIIVQTAAQEFYVAGTGVVITFRNIKKPNVIVGILKTDEGEFENEEWKVIRHLNGDQTHQGRHIRIMIKDYAILRFELYEFE